MTDMAGMCSCDIGDYDEVRAYEKSHPVARKKHRCYECNQHIQPGEKYEAVRVLTDEGWDTLKTHLACAGIRRDFCCGIHGTVAEVFADTYGFSPWEVPE